MSKLVAACLLCIGTAYGQTPMPVRVAFSGMHSSGSLYNILESATVEFRLPESGEFFANADLETSYVLLGQLAGCDVNFVNKSPIELAGKRDGQKIELTLRLTSPNHDSIKCPRTPPVPVIKVPIEDVTDGTELYVADGANRGFSMEHGDLSYKGKTTLQFACAVTVANPSPPTINMNPPLGQDPWPLAFDNTQTSLEIRARKSSPDLSRTSAGLTVIRGPKVSAHRDPTKAKFGGGLCVYVHAVTIEYEPIEILIDSHLQPGSCLYRGVKAHEDLHYQDYSDTLRESQRRMKEAAISAPLPSKERPWYVQDEAEADELISAVMKRTFRPIINELLEQGRAKAAERDTEENYDAVWRECLPQ